MASLFTVWLRQRGEEDQVSTYSMDQQNQYYNNTEIINMPQQ